MKRIIIIFLIIVFALLVLTSCGKIGVQKKSVDQGEKLDSKNEKSDKTEQNDKEEKNDGVNKIEIIDGCIWITYNNDPENPINIGSIKEEVENYKKEDVVSEYTEGSYIGDNISLKNTFNYKQINKFCFDSTTIPTAFTGVVQCFAFYDEYIIFCFCNGGIAIYNSDFSLYKEYVLEDVGTNFHAANCFLYGTNKDSDFPYLYLSETTGEKRCAIVSFENDSATVKGWLSFSDSFGTGNDYFDWNYDPSTNHLFLVGYDDYSHSNNHILIKDIGEMTNDLNKVYSNLDVKSTKHDYHMSVLQGGCFYNEKMYYVGNGVYGEGLYVYNTYSETVFKSYVHIKIAESEGCCIKDNKLYYLFDNGEFFELIFD